MIEPELVMERLEGLYGRPENSPHHDPVAELVLTILSQNTSDRNSGKAFVQLMGRFGSWAEIADAPEEAVVEAIRVGGLAQQKAPRIQAALRAIAERNAGRFDLGFLETAGLEEAKSWLRSLPGVGPKTAACVLLFSLKLVRQRLGAIDLA